MTTEERARCIAYAKTEAALAELRKMMPERARLVDVTHDGTEDDPVELLADALLFAIDAQGGGKGGDQVHLEAALEKFCQLPPK